MSKLVHDRIEVLDRKLTDEGFLAVTARLARIGLYDYAAHQVLDEPGDDPQRIVKVYRDESDVFDSLSLASFHGKPVTDDHPPEMVNSSNWKKYSVGFSLQDIARDGDYMKGTLMITDAEAIDKISRGKVEISNGYYCDYECEPGSTKDGAKYDARQRNIRGNHIALVPKGRCGKECRILDCGCDATNCVCGKGKDEMLKRTVDGFTFEVSEQAGQAIDKLLGTVDALKAQIAAKDQELGKQAADHKATLDKVTGERDAAKAQIVSGAALDKLVADREAIKSKARKIAGDSFKLDGLNTDADIRRAVVAAKMGTDTVKDKSDDYVFGVFDSLDKAMPDTGYVPSNPLAPAFAGAHARDAGGRAEVDKAYGEEMAYLTQAWQGQQPTKAN